MDGRITTPTTYLHKIQIHCCDDREDVAHEGESRSPRELKDGREVADPKSNKDAEGTEEQRVSLRESMALPNPSSAGDDIFFPKRVGRDFLLKEGNS
eukprot:scaffold516_cov270-Pinguiococcus_pyrenoidosus.AAC.11